MANRQVTVLNPSGYQELLQSADTLVVQGDVNMSSNLIGGLPAPVSDNDAVRKKYVDDSLANVSLDLQGVTDNGSTTTNSISAAGASFTGVVTIGATSNTSITSSSDGGGGYHTMLENDSTGDVYIRGTEVYIQDNGNSNKEWIHCLPGGSVELSYDGDKAIETDDRGITVFSSTTGLAGQIDFGTQNNCHIEVYNNDASNSAINNETLKIYSQHGANNSTKTSILYEGFFDQVWRTTGSYGYPAAELGRVNHDGGWEFNYHDIQGNVGNNYTGTTSNKKLETTATGVTVTGALTADSIDCGIYAP